LLRAWLRSAASEEAPLRLVPRLLLPTLLEKGLLLPVLLLLVLVLVLVLVLYLQVSYSGLLAVRTRR